MVSQIWNFRIYWRSYILAILLGKLIKSFFLLSGCRKYTQKTLRNLSFRIWIISWWCRWRVLLVMSQVGLSLSVFVRACACAHVWVCTCVSCGGGQILSYWLLFTILVGANSSAAGDWVNCGICGEWAHFGCDRRQGLGAFKVLLDNNIRLSCNKWLQFGSCLCLMD